jgi:dTDP-4-amino-4,6-dideoxygalactose transaminase
LIVPKQIIYSMRYIRPWLNPDARSDEHFCAAISTLLGGTHVIPIGRARAGIYLLVKNAIDSQRRRVILSSYTILDVVNMVKLAGGEPVFVDFLPNSTNVDLKHLESLIDARTACVMLTHYHVSQDKLSDVAQTCRSRGIKLFDDCAICLGATIGGARVGTLTEGSIFSFSGFKILNYLWGGIVAVRDDHSFAAINAEVSRWDRLKLTQYGKQALKILPYAAGTSSILFPLIFQLRRAFLSSGKIEHIMPISRLETTSLDETIRSRPSLAALDEWIRKLPGIDDIVNHRRSIADVYDRYFRDISVAPETSDAIRRESAFVNYPIVVGQKRRDQVYRDILNRGFDVGLSLYPNVHETESYRSTEGRTTNVTMLVRSVLTLPTHTRVTAAYVDELAVTVRKVLGRT